MTDRRKKNKTIKKPITMITFSLILLLLINNIMASVFNVLNSATDSVEGRKISVQMSRAAYEAIGSRLEACLKQSTEVVDYYMGNSVYISQSKDNDIVLGNGVAAYTLELEKYMITDNTSLEDGEILVEKYIGIDGRNLTDGDGYVDGEQLIGKTIVMDCRLEVFNMESGESVRLESISKEFKIAGVYDNLKTGEYAGVIMTKNAYRGIFEEAAARIDDYTDSAGIGNTDEYNYCISVIVDKAENIETVKQKLGTLLLDQEVHISALEIYETEEVQTLRTIHFFCNFVAVFFILMSAINIHTYISDSIDRRKREFGIMKAIGYRDAGVSKVLFRETLMEIFIPLAVSYGVALVLFTVMNKLMEANFSVLYSYLLKLHLNIEVNLIVVAVAVCIPFAGFVEGALKINRLEPVEALR